MLKENLAVTPTLQSDQDDPNTLKNLVAVISSLTSTISDIKKSLNDLVSEKKLRKEIEELKADKQLTNTAGQQPEINLEEAVVEATEGIRRENNTIIRGLPEPQGSSEECKAKDVSEHVLKLSLTTLVLLNLFSGPNVGQTLSTSMLISPRCNKLKHITLDRTFEHCEIMEKLTLVYGITMACLKSSNQKSNF